MQLIITCTRFLLLMIVLTATISALLLTGTPQRAYEALALLRELAALSPSSGGGKPPMNALVQIGSRIGESLGIWPSFNFC